MEITEKLITPNQWSRPQKLNTPRWIVLHWTAVPNQGWQAVWNFFEGRKNGLDSYGSSHYVVGLKGEIVRMIPDTEMAYHVGSKTYTNFAKKYISDYPNDSTLGIEMCVVDNDGNYNSKTWQGAVSLVSHLCTLYAIQYENIITHHMVVGWKDCPRKMVKEPWILECFRRDVATKVRAIYVQKARYGKGLKIRKGDE
jgi:N-acetylmuramoyl-L-alanine amidase